jgi:hypothetical protein
MAKYCMGDDPKTLLGPLAPLLYVCGGQSPPPQVPPLKHANVLVRDPNLSLSLASRERKITKKHKTKQKGNLKKDCPWLSESLKKISCQTNVICKRCDEHMTNKNNNYNNKKT